MRPKQGPIFQGLPSPSLKKMKRMSPEELHAHVRTLDEHASIIRAKIERQKHHPQQPSLRKAKAAQRQLERLVALMEYGRSVLRERGEGVESDGRA